MGGGIGGYLATLDVLLRSIQSESYGIPSDFTVLID